MPNQPVSVTVPVNQGIDRAKRLLFQPFDLSKWFTIGFCAWLAYLGETGFSFNMNFGHRSGGDFRHEWERARDYVMSNLYWILPLAAALIIISILVGIVFAWLRSRGAFMFLHCVALEKAEVSVPWRRYALEGNSLFLFRIVLGLAAWISGLPSVAMLIVLIVRMVRRGEPDVRSIVLLAAIVLMLVVAGLAFLLVVKLTRDFVVPVMFLRGGTCLTAWTEVLGLISVNVSQFVVYLLFQAVLAMATGAIVVIAILATCCLAGCLLMIPYLGTVLLLPVLVFQRSYSLHYLAQYGREYDVFAPAGSAG